MPTKRQDRLNALLQETAAEFVRGIANNQSLITVTRADVSPDIRQATIFFTTIPDTQEQIAEERFEARAAHGPGVELVNVITGEKYTT